MQITRNRSSMWAVKIIIPKVIANHHEWTFVARKINDKKFCYEATEMIVNRALTVFEQTALLQRRPICCSTRCDQPLTLFLLHINRAQHDNIHLAGKWNNFHDHVVHTVLDHHLLLIYTCFCDHWYNIFYGHIHGKGKGCGLPVTQLLSVARRDQCTNNVPDQNLILRPQVGTVCFFTQLGNTGHENDNCIVHKVVMILALPAALHWV